jgi:hypothetical protein
MVRPPNILAAESARPVIYMATSTPRTDGEDTESQSTREGSVATDDSVRRRAASLAYADALLGRINPHS